MFFACAVSVMSTTSMLTPNLSSSRDVGPLEATENEKGLIPSPLKMKFSYSCEISINGSIYLKVAFKLSNPEASILKPSLPKFCFHSLSQNKKDVTYNKSNYI